MSRVALAFKSDLISSSDRYVRVTSQLVSFDSRNNRIYSATSAKSESLSLDRRRLQEKMNKFKELHSKKAGGGYPGSAPISSSTNPYSQQTQNPSNFYQQSGKRCYFVTVLKYNVI